MAMPQWKDSKRISGSAKIRRLLRRLSDTVQADVRKEIAAAAQRIFADTVPAIPEPGSGHPYATGFLRTAVKIKYAKDGLQARVGWFGKFYERAAHAHLVEFGTAPGERTARDGSTYFHPGTPPNPMLIPAARKNRRENFVRIRAAIRKAMEHASRYGGAA